MSIQTTYWGIRPELVEVLDLGARCLIKPQIVQFGPTDAVTAYRQLAEGSIQAAP